MRNKIIETAIDEIIENSQYSPDFKSAFKQFVKNKFDGNSKDSDLKRVLILLDDVMEEEDE